MSGSIEFTDNNVKIITQYYELRNLLFEIADTAEIDLSKMDAVHRELATNIILRNFLGEESYNKYVNNLGLTSTQMN